MSEPQSEATVTTLQLTPNRAMPHVAVGAMILLTLGGLDLSILTAPSYAQKQLQLAAKNTLSLSSFVLQDVNTLSPVSPGAGRAQLQSNTVTVVYQAPDRVLESIASPTGQNVSVLVVGSDRYERLGNRRWIRHSVGASLGHAYVHQVLFPIEAISGATGVVRHGSSYAFVPSDFQRLLLQLDLPPSQLSSVNFSASIGGEFLTEALISGVRAGERLTVDLRFSAFDHAPAIHTPPPSEVSAAPAHR